MLNIVLFGAPGCGKGTQAARLKEKYGIDHVSTGNVIREEIARGTKLGKEMESYITTGRLAPDQVVIDMIADYIAAHKHAKGNIFDGFPRTTHQAEEFDRMLSEQGLKVDVMIYMDVPEEELVKRKTHQDLGQMQMYVNYYTRELMNPGDNPPVGIVLCAEKNDAVVRYTLPEDEKQVFAAQYMTYLPTQEELQTLLQEV